MYSAYKYLLGWCADQPDALETGGMYYPKALGTVFVALYLEEVCLAGLLFLSTKPGGGRTPSGLAGGVIMVSRLTRCHKQSLILALGHHGFHHYCRSCLHEAPVQQGDSHLHQLILDRR